jgi:hypothetical protein
MSPSKGEITTKGILDVYPIEDDLYIEELAKEYKYRDPTLSLEGICIKNSEVA